MRTESKKNRRFAAAGAAFLGASLLLLWAAREFPGFVDWYTVHIYPVWVGMFGRIFGVLPFSAAEIGLYLLAGAAALYIIRNWRRPADVGARALFWAGALFLSYSLNCGVNYSCRPFSADLPYGREERTEEELAELCAYLAEQANRLADWAGVSLTPGEYAAEGRAAMGKLGEEYPRLAGYYPQPKYLTFPWILSVQQLSGVYSPFTVEANYNNAMVSYNIPHTICHELSHLKGFMREDEANFIGFLACLESDSPAFAYSGYTMGWIYAGNALAKEPGGLPSDPQPAG